MWCLRGREESIMTRGFCPEQWKKGINMEIQRLEGAGLEGEHGDSVLDLLNLLDIQVEMNPHYNFLR